MSMSLKHSLYVIPFVVSLASNAGNLQVELKDTSASSVSSVQAELTRVLQNLKVQNPTVKVTEVEFSVKFDSQKGVSDDTIKAKIEDALKNGNYKATVKNDD